MLDRHNIYFNILQECNRSLLVSTEIFEFDAMDEPPSVLDVEISDFSGPFDEATSLGHAEINFVKTNISDLADLWIPLRGKLAQACQSKLHLRIFLNNTRGGNVVNHFINKMEKEVGKKVRMFNTIEIYIINVFFLLYLNSGALHSFCILTHQFSENYCRLLYVLHKLIQHSKNSLAFHQRNFLSMTSHVT